MDGSLSEDKKLKAMLVNAGVLIPLKKYDHDDGYGGGGDGGDGDGDYYYGDADDDHNDNHDFNEDD